MNLQVPLDQTAGTVIVHMQVRRHQLGCRDHIVVQAQNDSACRNPVAGVAGGRQPLVLLHQIAEGVLRLIIFEKGFGTVGRTIDYDDDFKRRVVERLPFEAVETLAQQRAAVERGNDD